MVCWIRRAFWKGTSLPWTSTQYGFNELIANSKEMVKEELKSGATKEELITAYTEQLNFILHNDLEKGAEKGDILTTDISKIGKCPRFSQTLG